MDSLHEKRGEFVRHVAESLRENLRAERHAARLGVADAAGPGGLRLARREQRVQRRRACASSPRSSPPTRSSARDRGRSRDRGAADAARGDQAAPQLLQQQEEQAQIGQRLEIEKIKAGERRRGGQAREQAMVATENARIERERETEALEIAKQRELRRLEIEAQLSSEMRKVDSSIQLAAKHVEEAKAQAEAELARTEIVLAQEHVQTERERAVADRSREMALKRVQEEGEVEAAKAETEAAVLHHDARKAEAQATAHARRGASASACSPSRRARRRGSRPRTRAPTSLMHLRARALSARQAARDRRADDEAGREDRQHPHPPGDAASAARDRAAAAAASGGARAPPVNQVMDSILGMALQLPALKSIGESIGYDFSRRRCPRAEARPRAQQTAKHSRPKSDAGLASFVAIRRFIQRRRRLT